ncbi:MAG: putative two-component histidine kinase [Actinomycetia bacterium]|jgi:two-component system OmpR family sensor kinase|nr:putative two-component histidine kinase [Actinomycetes bacterium]
MTLRARLIVALIVLGVAVASAGIAVVVLQRRYLVNQVDRQLATARPAAFRLARGRLSPPGADAPRPPVDLRRAPPAGVPTDLFELYVATVSGHGTVTNTVAPGLQRFGAPDLQGRNIAALVNKGPITVAAAGGTSYRARVLRAADSYLVLALPLDHVAAATQRLLIVMSIAAALTIGILVLVWWSVLRLGLRPIQEMTAAADAIAGGELDRRVENLPPRTEVERLGRAFNVMLDERQAAEERLRRFVSDASHELRTPLTSIRGYTELYRRNGLDEPGALDDAMRRVGQEAARMNDLVEDMLLLARLDEGRTLEQAPVDLTELVRDAANDATAVQPARSIGVEADDQLMTTGDENRLRQVFGALLTNALVHTPESVLVTVRGYRDGGMCAIEVEDGGAGMNADLAQRAFGRFVRGDQSRGRHHGGSGLGLSIVQSVVIAHGGRVSLRTAPDCGTTIRVLLPASNLNGS